MEIINIFQTHPWLFVFVIGILGLVVGSFLNVVIYRLPLIVKDEYEKSCTEYFKLEFPQPQQVTNLATPRSYCPSCEKVILWWQNIPIISYILLKGQCYNCKKAIPKRYLMVEIISCIASIMIALQYGCDIQTLPILVLTWSLIALTFIDIEHQLLPDQLTLPLIWLGLLVNTSSLFASPENAIIGAASGYLFLWLIAKGFKILRKVDGMGNGDFKLLAVFGAWFGWQILPMIVMVASIIGVIIGISLVLIKKNRFNQQIPFGPYLAAAGWVIAIWGQSTLNWY